MAISAQSLSKVYRSGLGARRVRALTDLSLEVPKGSLFGLLGPNGAGKTTFIKLLLGIIRPTGGACALGGRPPERPQSRFSVGYLPEVLSFPPKLRAGDMLDILGRMDGMVSSDRRVSVARWLKAVGLESWVDHKIGTFSKGMKRRLGLAHALLRDPEVLILDEPTDGLDPVGQRLVRDLLADLAAEGKTVFLNSHQLAEVESVCTGIAILREGTLLWEGTVADLIRTQPATEIRCSTLESPESFGLEPVGENRYLYKPEGQPELDTLLATLLGRGISIYEVRPLERSLEESFVGLVTGRG